MKFLILIGLLITTNNVFASEPLKGCYDDVRNAEFFVHHLEELAKDNETPVLLLNENKKVVGLISVSPDRSTEYPNKAKKVRVNELSFCSSPSVSDFFYADGLAADLLDWPGAASGAIEIMQDEGLIVLDVSLVEKFSYATYVKANFKVYDVFSFDPEKPVGENSPDFLRDWGLPVAKGIFYFYIPKGWVLK